jgi:hypothetical protein
MSQIDSLINQIQTEFSNNPSLERQIELELGMYIRNAYTDIIKQNIGYCAVLKVPEVSIASLLEKVKIDIRDVKSSFLKDWEIPNEKTYMWSDPYYHILSLFAIYGIKNNKDNMAKNAVTLILMKLWNGRKIKYIRYCERALLMI